jgi:hypothetical membrane protein
VVTESELHFISSIAIFLSAIIPIYLGVHLRRDLRKLAIMLAGFIIVHGIYHLLGFLGNKLLADGVFEPLSVIALIAFGSVYLLARNGKQRMEAKKT